MKKRPFLFIPGFFVLSLIFSCSSETDVPRPDFPRPDHVVIVVEENHGFDQIMGSKYAPYINQLARESAVFIHSRAITHPSQPNYLALFSGSRQGVRDDECLPADSLLTTPNLGAALLLAGLSFAGYSEGLPATGSTVCSHLVAAGYQYARKHAPWVNWQGSVVNGLPPFCNQPFSHFPDDFNELPVLSFVIPDLGNDMHNLNLKGGETGAIQRADQWLNDHLSAYVEWAKTHNSLFILTFDEDQTRDTTKNRILTFFNGPMVLPGEYRDSINHYHVLRTLEAMYHLSPSGDAKAAVIKTIWK